MTESVFSQVDAYIRDAQERERLSIQCLTCNCHYIPGRVDEWHAEWHADFILWRRKSRPEPRLAAYDGDVRVDAASPEWLHHIVDGYAVGLTYDPGFAEPQWNVDRPSEMDVDQRDLHALVLVEDKFIPVGAVAFSQIIRDGRAPVWRMMFASIDDEWRRRGVMSRRWPGWRKIYGDFELEKPLSRAMTAFVAKRAGEAS
jgi:hypothetical protein